jgi:hypothetical protein
MYIAAVKFIGSMSAGLTAFIVYPSHLLFLVLVPTYAGPGIACLVIPHRSIRARSDDATA